MGSGVTDPRTNSVQVVNPTSAASVAPRRADPAGPVGSPTPARSAAPGPAVPAAPAVPASARSVPTVAAVPAVTVVSADAPSSTHADAVAAAPAATALARLAAPVVAGPAVGSTVVGKDSVNAAVSWSAVVKRSATKKACRATVLNTTVPDTSRHADKSLSQLLEHHNGAPVLPIHSSSPSLHLVTTEKGLAKLRVHLPPSATIASTPFEFNRDLFFAQISDAPTSDPATITDILYKAHIPCLCGRPESAVDTPGLVYCLNGSALAESRGTITVGVRTLRTRPDGTREFAAEWATQLWLQKALALLKPAAAAVTPHGHLLMVPAADQTLATLQQLAEDAGLQRMAIRLPAAAAFVARLRFASGSDTDVIFKWQRAIMTQAATQGLSPIGHWSHTDSGECALQLMLDAGRQPVDEPQILRVGAGGLASICRKGEKNPWLVPPPGSVPAQAATPTAKVRAPAASTTPALTQASATSRGPMPRPVAAAAAKAAAAAAASAVAAAATPAAGAPSAPAAAAKAAAAAAASAVAAAATPAVGAPTPPSTPPVSDATAGAAATTLADTGLPGVEGRAGSRGTVRIAIDDTDDSALPALAAADDEEPTAAVLASTVRDAAAVTAPTVVAVAAVVNRTPVDPMTELLMFVRQRAGKDVRLPVTEPADDEIYEMCKAMNKWEVTVDVVKKLELWRSDLDPRWSALRTEHCAQ